MSSAHSKSASDAASTTSTVMRQDRRAPGLCWCHLNDGIFSTIVDPVWPEIFEKCGISYQQLAVSDYIERHLHWSPQLVYARLRAPTPLSDFDVAAILPRNRSIPLHAYLPPRPPGTLLALADAPAPDVPAIESF